MRFPIWLCIGSLFMAAIVGWILGHFAMVLTIAIVCWMVYVITLVKSGVVQSILYVTLVLLLSAAIYKGWFTKNLPMTVRALSTLPLRTDVEMATATFDPGVHHDSILTAARMDLDSMHAVQFKAAVDLRVAAVKKGYITPDSMVALISDSLEPALQSYKAQQNGMSRAGRKLMHTDTTKGTVTYNVKNRELRVGPVPAHCKIVLTGSTTGYTCGTGNIPTTDGGTYFATAVLHPEQFLAPGLRIFCIFAELSETEEQVPFENDTCALENRSDDAQECIIQVNERDCNTCWMDNTGTVLITYTIEPIS